MEGAAESRFLCDVPLGVDALGLLEVAIFLFLREDEAIFCFLIGRETSSGAKSDSRRFRTADATRPACGSPLRKLLDMIACACGVDVLDDDAEEDA